MSTVYHFWARGRRISKNSLPPGIYDMTALNMRKDYKNRDLIDVEILNPPGK